MYEVAGETVIAKMEAIITRTAAMLKVCPFYGTFAYLFAAS